MEDCAGCISQEQYAALQDLLTPGNGLNGVAWIRATIGKLSGLFGWSNEVRLAVRLWVTRDNVREVTAGWPIGRKDQFCSVVLGLPNYTRAVPADHHVDQYCEREYACPAFANAWLLRTLVKKELERHYHDIARALLEADRNLGQHASIVVNVHGVSPLNVRAILSQLNEASQDIIRPLVAHLLPKPDHYLLDDDDLIPHDDDDGGSPAAKAAKA